MTAKARHARRKPRSQKRKPALAMQAAAEPAVQLDPADFAGPLSPDKVLGWQRTIGNQAVMRKLHERRQLSPSTPEHIQRAKLGTVVAQSGGWTPRRGPSDKAKKDRTTLVTGNLLKELERVPDEQNPQSHWVHIEALSVAKKEYKGYVPEAGFQDWGEVPDHLIGNITKPTSLRQTAEKKGTEVGMLGKGVVIQVVDDNPVNGYIKVRVLDQDLRGKDGFVRADRHVTSNMPISLDKAGALQSKSKHIIGEEKVNRPGSREESAKTLVATVSERAQQLVDVLTSKGVTTLDAFQRVAFILAGGGEGSLEAEFKQVTGGSELRAVINRTFTGKPGKYASHYLISMLDNSGEPSLKMQVAIPLGLVDSSGALSAGLTKIPKLGDKIGSLGDAQRVRELLERGEPLERAAVMGDPEFSEKIKKLDKKVFERVNAKIDVDKAKRIAESAGPQSLSKAKQQLAVARDQQLGLMVSQCIKTLPLGPLKPKYAFDTKKFHDDLVKWKSEASAEDLLQIKRTSSAFQQALKQVPTNWQLGLRGTERQFITDFLDSVDVSGSEMQVQLVKGQLKRQAKSVERGKRGGRFKTRITGFITERKWADISSEIEQLTAKQRDDLLAEYDANNRDTALQLLEADLKAAGMNKEERIHVIALFNTEFGEAGDNYIELWELVEPNKRSRAKDVLGHLAPSKIKKFGEARKGLSIGDSAAKIIMSLEDNEFALVRQDTELLDKLRAHSTDKTWQKILDLLGMQSIDQQVTGIPSRAITGLARREAEFNAKRWAIKLDKAIEENLIGSGVSSGREKAQLYVIANEAQAIAREFSQGDPYNEPEFLATRFLRSVLVELDKKNPKKTKYLEKRVPEVYAAFTENTQIEIGTWLKRAKHEGFGIGGLRKVDRQKLFWSLDSMSGAQLLDEWSNIGHFRGLYAGMKHAEGEMDSLNQKISGTILRAEKQEFTQQRTVIAEQLVKIREEMNNFVLGIKDERRADMRKLGVNKEDRLKFEQMVTDKLTDAMSDDEEVQQAMTDISLPYDDFMQAKMKGVDALEMQRFLDTTRQWFPFSTKSSQLDEGTRGVKGAILTSESEQRKAKQEGKSEEDIKELRKTGAKKSEEAIEDRKLLEARFRDMQETFRARAMALFKLVAFAIVTGLSAGIGGPLSIGIQFAVEAGLAIAQGLFRYYVLGEKNLSRIIIDTGLEILGATVRVLTGNLAAAMNLSVLHPDALGEQLSWLAKPISKSISGTINKVVMFAPNQLVKQIYQDKSLEKVIKEGEDQIGDKALEMLGKQAGAVVGKFAVGALKEYGIRVPQEAIMGPSAPKPVPAQKSFGTAYQDRLAGGATTEEQQGMWGRYERQKKKDVKKGVITAIKTEKKREHEKKLEGKQRKKWMKEIRGKEVDSPQLKTVKDILEAHEGLSLDELLDQGHLTTRQLSVLVPDDRGELEEELKMEPGELDRFLMLRNMG